MLKKCKICGTDFEPTRPWSEYCKDDCRNKANTIRVKKHRKKTDLLKIKSISELKTSEPYKSNYKKIIKNLSYDKEITWTNLYKKTGLTRDTLSKYIKTMSKFGIVEENRYILSNREKFEPLRIWYEDFINKCSAHNILTFSNSSLFFPKLISLKDIEKKQLNTLMWEHIKTYNKINNFFRIIGLRMAEEIWLEELKKIKTSTEIRFYYWINLILIHYLATINYAIENESYRHGEIPHVNMDIIRIIKFHNFKPPFPLTFFKRNSVSDIWQKDLFKFFKEATFRYLKGKKFDLKKNKKQVEAVREEFHSIFEKSLIKRAESEFFLSVVHPEPLTYFGIKDISRTEKSKSIDAWHASIFKDESDEIFEILLEDETLKTSFFDDSSFFDGFENEIKKLFDNVQDLKNQLRDLAKTFECPMIEKPD